jgi:hypothetical protein
LKNLSGRNLHLALVHYPVVNKNGATVSAAVTNLDLHDIARAATTYGVQSFYVVTPLKDQQVLIEKIIAHWSEGAGALYNPARQKALKRIRLEDSLEGVLAHVGPGAPDADRPVTIATSAKGRPGTIGCRAVKQMLDAGRPCVLVLGTAWGLAEEVLSGADYVLAPIRGPADYNHLSVRSAASIILDRMFGARENGKY